MDRFGTSVDALDKLLEGGLRRGALGDATVGIVEECRHRMVTPEGELSKPDDLAILMYRPIGGEPRRQKRSR